MTTNPLAEAQRYFRQHYTNHADRILASGGAVIPAVPLYDMIIPDVLGDQRRAISRIIRSCHDEVLAARIRTQYPDTAGLPIITAPRGGIRYAVPPEYLKEWSKR